MDDEIRDDTLKGLEEITDFLGEDNIWRTQRLLTKKIYPAAKVMGRWEASKRAIRQRRSQLFGGEAAD